MRLFGALLAIAAAGTANAASPACAASCGAVTPWTRPANGTIPPPITETPHWEHSVPGSDLVSFPWGRDAYVGTPTPDGGTSTGVDRRDVFYMWGQPLPEDLVTEALGVPVAYTVTFDFRASPNNAVGSPEAPALLSELSLRVGTRDTAAIAAGTRLRAQNDNHYAEVMYDSGSGPQPTKKIDLGPQTDITALNAWTTHTATFTLPATCTSCSLFFAVVQADTTSTGSHSGNEYVFANVTITRPSVPVPAKTLWPSAKFRTADIYKAPTPADLWDAKTACPHLESGLSLWHEAATWGGSVPAAGSSPTIPANTHILVCSCSLPSDAAGAAAPFTLVTVPSTSSLIFDDAPITMHVGSIVGSGRVAAGSSTCRQDQEMSITFHGSKTTVLQGRPQPTSGNTKGLVVSGTGTLDLHGRRFFPTWTRLLATVQPGERHVYLQDGVNWEVGQRILVTTSHHLDGAAVHQNEVRVITAISTDGTVLYVDEAFTHQHWSGEEYQTEVGLLSRVLTLQGAEGDSSVATGSFGGHVMWTGGAVGRVTGTRFSRMGQTNVLARYAVHMHLLGDTDGLSWVSDSAVEKSFYRCIVVHGTDESIVNENVCYDVIGHAIYMSEDGLEERNVITYNLAAHVHCIGTPAAGSGQAGEDMDAGIDLINPADRAAAGFYITNAWNVIKGNAASGGWTGFSHPNLAEYIGVYENTPPPANMAPEERPTLEWVGNSAHSSGFDWNRGSCIYVGGRLWHDQTRGGLLVYRSGRERRNTKDPVTGDPAWMFFQHTRVWLCQRGVNHWGNQAEVHHFEATDTARAAVLFGEAIMADAVITGRSNNPQATMERTGFQAYDTSTKTLLSRVTFRNFDASKGDYAMYAMTHHIRFKPQFINIAQDITWENVDRSIYYFHDARPPYSTGASRMYSWLSLDGTMVDRHGPWIVGAHTDWWHLDDETCEWDTDWGIWLCKQKPGRSVASLDLEIPGYMDDDIPPPHNHLGYMSLLRANRSIPFTVNPTHSGVAGDSGWYWRPDHGAPTNWHTNYVQVVRGHYVPLAVKYPPGTTFSVTIVNTFTNIAPVEEWAVPQLSALSEVFADPSTGLREISTNARGACSGQQVGNSILCDDSYMGAPGPGWFWDGEFLWLRIVQVSHYMDRTYDRSWTWSRDGMTLPDIERRLNYKVVATCPAGTLVMGGDFCTVPDSIPLEGQPMPGDIDVSDDDEPWVPSPTPSVSPAGTPTPSITAAATSAATPTPSSSPAASPTPSRSVGASPAPTGLATVSPSPTGAATPTAESTPAGSPSGQATPAPSSAASPSPAATVASSPAASTPPATGTAPPSAAVSTSPAAAASLQASPSASPATGLGAGAEGAEDNQESQGTDATTAGSGQASDPSDGLQGVGGAGGLVGILLAVVAVGIIVAAVVFRTRIAAWAGLGGSAEAATTAKVPAVLAQPNPIAAQQARRRSSGAASVSAVGLETSTAAKYMHEGSGSDELPDTNPV